MAQWDYLFADEPAKTDKGPEARRAASGKAPGPRTSDPDLVLDKPGAAPAVGGSANEPQFNGPAGRLEKPPPNLEPGAPAAIPDPTKFRTTEGTRPPTELEGDPMLQGMVGTAMTMPIGVPLLGAAGRAGVVARTLATPGVGAAQGGITARMQGQDPKEGAALGAMFSLPAAIESVGVAMRPGGSLDTGVVKDLAGDMSATERQQARHIGYAKTAETARRYGVVGAPTPDRAHASVKAGLEAVGEQIGQTYDTIGNEYARPAGGFMSNVQRDTQSMRGTVSGNAKADAIETEAQRIQDANGGAPMTLRKLRRELSDYQREGYGEGKFEKLDPTESAEVGRVIARHLGAELEAGLTAAKADPRFASMVDRLQELNPTYSALKVLEATTGRQVDRAMLKRAPTAVETVRAVQPVGGQPLPAAARTVKMPTGRRLGMPLPATPLQLAPGLAASFADDPEKRDQSVKESLRGIFFGGGGGQ